MNRLVLAATHLGDAALLLPASLGLFGLLLWRSPRAALLWAALVAACLSATLAAKLLLHACGPALRSPSGHAAFSALFYGCAAVIVTDGLGRAARAAAAAAALAVVAAIAVSRVWLDYHSPEEVAAGLGIGGLGVAAFALARPRLGRPLPSAPLLAAGLVALAVLVGGRHLGVEHWVGRGARWLPALDLCL